MSETTIEHLRTRIGREDDATPGVDIASCPDIETREANLRAILLEMASVVVAYSGGVDSTFLLKVAHETLGEKAIGAIGRSPSLPQTDFQQAVDLASLWGVRTHILETEEMADVNYTSNSPDRCYFCKSELYAKLCEFAQQNGFQWIADGTNLDDTGDYRPGRVAAEERQVRSPLLEARLTKQDIRALSRRMGLPTWEKPEAACLASRIPHGIPVTSESLEQIDKAEDFLRSLGLRQVRVRHHETIARIETAEEEIEKLLDSDVRQQIVNYLRRLGYKFVTVDLAGYHRGSFVPESSQPELVQIDA